MAFLVSSPSHQPTSQGGTHVNGLRSGLTDALKEFCEFRNLLPKNIKLTTLEMIGTDCIQVVVNLQCKYHMIMITMLM
jgi:topoisomerase-4 subunit B